MDPLYNKPIQKHQAALSQKTSLSLGAMIALLLGGLSLQTTANSLLIAKLLWSSLVGGMAYRVFVTGRVGRWRSAFFIILAWAFIIQFKAQLIGLTGSAFITSEVQEVPYCHIAIASSFLNHLYQQYLAFMSGSWQSWSPLTWGALWLGITLVLGQAWCSWACFYGGLDNGFARILRRPKIKWLKLPKGLRDLPAAILVATLLLSLVVLKPVFCLWLCPLKLGTGFLDPDYLTRQIQLAIFVLIGILFLVILPLLTKKRAFCGLICPFGAWQAFFGKINPYRVSIVGEKCTRCLRCVVACPTFAIEKGIGDSPQKAGTVPNLLPYCNRCGECMDVCASGAIDYAVGWGSRNFFVGGTARVLFLISAWLVGGAISLLFVPEVLLKLWHWAIQ